MRIQPLENYELLGTEIKLDKTKVYNALWADNQPDWEARGLIFVDVGVKTHKGTFANFAMLLSKDEYIIRRDGY